jgi:hypothetical protein
MRKRVRGKEPMKSGSDSQSMSRGWVEQRTDLYPTPAFLLKRIHLNSQHLEFLAFAMIFFPLLF